MTQPAIYTVQSGDSLFSIAQRFYGDGNKWPLIYDYCNSQVIGQNPDLIRAWRSALHPTACAALDLHSNGP